MYNFLLEVYNGAVVSDKVTGSTEPDAIVNSVPNSFYISIILALVIGFLLGYFARSIVQKYKEAPDEKDNTKSE